MRSLKFKKEGFLVVIQHAQLEDYCYLVKFVKVVLSCCSSFDCILESSFDGCTHLLICWFDFSESAERPAPKLDLFIRYDWLVLVSQMGDTINLRLNRRWARRGVRNVFRSYKNG